MSKRYKGKDTHYRLQIKKDGEWQDLGLVASAEMDNVDNNNTTTTNFDEKYIHKNNDKNDWNSKDKTDIKTTDLTFQTSILGKTPKIMFENTDASTKDLAEIYLDTQQTNKSTLRFVLGDDKGGESTRNNETISFDWRNGEESSRQAYYTFTESQLQATNVTASFATVQSNTYNNSAGAKMLDFSPTDKEWETNIYNGHAGKDSTLSIWGSTKNDTAEASIQYRNKTDAESWTVGINTGGKKDNSFAWYSHKPTVGDRMWLTHDGELHLTKDNQNVTVKPTGISLQGDDTIALSYVSSKLGTDWFRLAFGNEGDEPLEFNWVNGDGKIVENRKGWLQYPGAQKKDSDPQLVWSSELDSRLSSEFTQRTDDLTFKENTTDKGIKWQNESDTARIYTEGVNNDLSLVLEVRDDGNEKIVFRGKQNGRDDKNVTVNMGTLTADQDIEATNSFKLGKNATISYNNADQCVDFLF